MRFRNGHRGRGGAGALVLTGLATCLCGCPPGQNADIGRVPSRVLGNDPPMQQAQLIEADQIATRDDIVQIPQFWGPAPWLYNAERGPVGFKVTVYFNSAGTGRGAFVSGTIVCKLFVIGRAPDGTSKRDLVWTWRMGPAEAMNFRVRKLTVMGYPYSFYLTWPEELKLIGREVEIQFFYERQDGRVIPSAPRRFKVS